MDKQEATGGALVGNGNFGRKWTEISGKDDQKDYCALFAIYILLIMSVKTALIKVLKHKRDFNIEII